MDTPFHFIQTQNVYVNPFRKGTCVLFARAARVLLSNWCGLLQNLGGGTLAKAMVSHLLALWNADEDVIGASGVVQAV